MYFRIIKSSAVGTYSISDKGENFPSLTQYSCRRLMVFWPRIAWWAQPIWSPLPTLISGIPLASGLWQSEIFYLRLLRIVWCASDWRYMYMVRKRPLVINILINNTQFPPSRFGEYVFIRIPYSAKKNIYHSNKRRWNKRRQNEPR